MDLETKDKQEKERDKELEVAAKLELEEWYVKYQEKIASIKAENRKRAEPQEDDAGESLEWDKVVDLCGFKSPKSVKDTSRMRSILLKLKESKT